MGRGLLLAASAAAGVSLAVAAGSSAAATYTDRVVGAELPPISSTLGTFAGIARGGLSGMWRVRILHQPLRTAQTVAITGGSFAMRTVTGRRLAESVTGGSVTVLDPGAACNDQIYAVDATLSAGRFEGLLTHHRHKAFGRCVIYAATIAGTATLQA